jgi:hypothetical protein
MIFKVAYLIYKTRCYNTRIKMSILYKAQLRCPKYFKSIFSINDTNVVILPNFIKK